MRGILVRFAKYFVHILYYYFLQFIYLSKYSSDGLLTMCQKFQFSKRKNAARSQENEGICLATLYNVFRRH